MDGPLGWCFVCRRLHHSGGGDGGALTTCPRIALEGIVEIVDAGAFRDSCGPQAWARRGAPGGGPARRLLLPATTVRDAGRTCAVCLNDLEPGASALVTPCGHAYHPRCITPWLEVNDTCPLCRAKSGLHAEDGGDAGSARDGLVLCELLDDGRWRYLLGRRVSGRIFAVRNLDQNGKLVRGSLLRRFSEVAVNLFRSRNLVAPAFR